MFMKKNILYLLLLLQPITFLLGSIEKHSADLIIFSFDRPLQLYALLESLQLYATDIRSTTIIYRTSNDRYNNAFKEVAQQFPHIQLFHQQNISDFKTLTVRAIEESTSDYVIFAVDDNIVKDTFSDDECIDL